LLRATRLRSVPSLGPQRLALLRPGCVWYKSQKR
jgi:hypothetical protein